MVSWWPHGLLVIDFLFHLPLEVAGVVLAYCAYSLFRSWRGGKVAGAIRAEDEALAGEAAR